MSMEGVPQHILITIIWIAVDVESMQDVNQCSLVHAFVPPTTYHLLPKQVLDGCRLSPSQSNAVPNLTPTLLRSGPCLHGCIYGSISGTLFSVLSLSLSLISFSFRAMRWW